MKRKLFNKHDRQDLHRLGAFMNAKFEIMSVEQLDSEDATFCRSVMYWHDHYANKGWPLPAWAQMPDFQGWLKRFRDSYHFCITYRNAEFNDWRDGL